MATCCAALSPAARHRTLAPTCRCPCYPLTRTSSTLLSPSPSTLCPPPSSLFPLPTDPDPDLPVRMDAAVSVRSFLDAVEEENLDELRPLVPRLLNQFLALSNEVCGGLAAPHMWGK